MTTESGAPAGDISAPADTSEISLTEARAMIDAAYNEPEEPSPSEINEAARAKMAERPSNESSQEDDAPEGNRIEEPEGDDPEAQLPPIERPRSWSKDDDDDWNALPRARQEKIAANEQAREADIRRRINEAADQRKAAQAERETAEKARQQYEAQLPSLMRELESVTQAQFGDIRTMDDVVKLQAEDPFRFQAWQVHQMRLQTAKQESDRAEGQKAQEKQSTRARYEAEQNKLLVELVPEMADPKKASELRERAIKMLTDDLGLTNDQLSQWMQDDTGHQILSNASIQKLIADGLKYRDIINAPKAVAAKPVPAVVRPGVARPSGAADSEVIQALEKRLSQTGSEKDAWALYEAKLKASNRRAS